MPNLNLLCIWAIFVDIALIIRFLNNDFTD